MHIAICDDEQKELLLLQALVNQFDSSLEISLFPSARSLLETIKKQRCDIILLDIEMDGMNGFAAAEKIAKMRNPPLVVFVTNSGEYTYRGYEVAFRYLPKPVSYSALANALAAAVAKISSQKFTITANGCYHVIPINDVLFFETFGHRLVVHTIGNIFECGMQLSEVEASLPGNTFASPHKGYLVNLDYVSTVNENSLSLTDETQIPISRRRKQEFEQALFRFVRRS